MTSTLKIIFIVQFKHSKKNSLKSIKKIVKLTNLSHRGVFNLDLKVGQWLTMRGHKG